MLHTSTPHVLLIEDSPEYHILVRAALADQFRLTVASNATEATREIAQFKFDLILIDVGLPGLDGLALCEELRRDPALELTPIMFVTGRRETADIVQGFAAGADDYIQKPFHPNELRARVEARLKRSSVSALKAEQAKGQFKDELQKAELKFSIGRQKVSFENQGASQDLNLTPNEFKILYHLAKNEGRTLSRSAILKEVWGADLHVVERTVDKHICSLRRKMGETSRYVASVPGEGYTFRIRPMHEAQKAAGFGGN